MDLRSLETQSLIEVARALRAGEVSAEGLAHAHLQRIESLDGDYNAVLVRNPDGLAIARALDAEFAAGRCVGPMHGVPILVKDNLDSADRMPTTAGSLALADTYASKDSSVLHRLRQAGAVLLGKTNLSEWANFRSSRSSSGWSSVGGQTRNAHDPLRTPGGSSSGSGVAVALGYVPAAIGTETDGSIVGPASMNGVVGFKPSVGLVSRAGIVPISASQDTAGPMARSVRDCAFMLNVIVGTDDRDLSVAQADTYQVDYVAALDGIDPSTLRIGIARECSGFHDRVDTLFDQAVAELRAAGVTVVDAVTIGDPAAVRVPERIVMEYEFKAGLNAYLDTREAGTVPADLDALIAFNAAHADEVMPYFGQEIQLRAQNRGRLDDEQYHQARALSVALAANEGIDAALREHQLDALIAPTMTPAWLIDWIGGDNRRGGAACAPAVAGYPHITVPMGLVEHLPVGLSVFSGAFEDLKVLQIANLFEQLKQA